MPLLDMDGGLLVEKKVTKGETYACMCQFTYRPGDMRMCTPISESVDRFGKHAGRQGTQGSQALAEWINRHWERIKKYIFP